jgi:hypothetical protein
MRLVTDECEHAVEAQPSQRLRRRDAGERGTDDDD